MFLDLPNDMNIPPIRELILYQGTAEEVQAMKYQKYGFLR